MYFVTTVNKVQRAHDVLIYCTNMLQRLSLQAEPLPRNEIRDVSLIYISGQRKFTKFHVDKIERRVCVKYPELKYFYDIGVTPLTELCHCSHLVCNIPLRQTCKRTDKFPCEKLASVLDLDELKGG